MLSSVIHARLEYQCGHAALVSLPRIKGETAAQRNARVAHEKLAALARQCDFCAPAIVEVVEVEPAPAPVAVEGPLELTVTPIESVSAAVDGVQLNGAEAVAEPGGEPGKLAAVEPGTPPAAAVAAPAAPGRRRATRRAATRRQQLREFLIQYRVERVIQAVDVHDALRQLASLGATDVLEIARQD